MQQLNYIVKYKVVLLVMFVSILILQLPQVQAQDESIEEKLKQKISKFDNLITEKLKQFKRYSKNSSNKNAHKKFLNNIKKNLKSNIDILKQDKDSNYLGFSSLIVQNGVVENLKFSINVTKNSHFEEYQIFINDLINLYLENKFEQAYNLVNHLIEEIPKNTFFLNLKAVILYELELNELSRNVLLNILKLDSKNVSAMNNLAILYTSDGDYNIAVEFMKKALKIEKHNNLIKKNLQEIYLIIKNYKKYFELSN